MKTFFVFLFTALVSLVMPAQDIERKIIIEGGRFYFTTIDAEFQIASLHTGNVSEALKTSKILALPAGRNYNDPIIPFSWDVLKDDFYAVNFLNHPMNDRNEALKRFKISSLKSWSDKVTASSMIMESVDLTPFANNDPYLSTIKKSNTLNNFFYDGIAVNDSNYCMAITNNNELSVWNYGGMGWKNSMAQKISVDGFFTLFEFKNRTYIFLNNGQTYEISTKTISEVHNKTAGASLSSGILVINKDDDTVKFIKNSALNYNIPLDELIKKKAIEIF